MLELLAKVLQQYGLQLNTKETMILCTDSPPESHMLVEVGDGFVELLSRNGVHKYLGRSFSGELRLRGQTALVRWFGRSNLARSSQGRFLIQIQPTLVGVRNACVLCLRSTFKAL